MEGWIILFAAGLVLISCGWWLLWLEEVKSIYGWLVFWPGVWLVMAAGEAFVPLWAPLGFAPLSWLVVRQWGQKQFAPGVPRITFHVLAAGFIFLMLSSTTSINQLVVLAGIFATILIGWVSYYLAHRIQQQWVAGIVIVVVVGFLLGPSGLRSLTRFDSMGRLGDTVLRGQLIQTGLMPAQQGEQVILANGSIAWLSRPAGSGPFPAALIFHGNDNDGSQQAAALILQKALLKEGYLVLALDHIGYGETPLPNLQAPLTQWDPQPGRLAAYDWLTERTDVDTITLVGHSMGADGVWRLLAERPEVANVYLFGASLAPLLEPVTQADVNWSEWEAEYERFHEKRGMTGRLDPDRYLAIVSAFYGTPLDEIKGGSPVQFIQFSPEWPDIVSSRQNLFAALPGPKTNIPFDSNHYLDATDWRGLLAGDTRTLFALERTFSSGIASCRLAKTTILLPFQNPDNPPA